MSHGEAFPLSDAEICAIRKEAIEFAGIGLYRYIFDGTVLFMDRGAAKILELEDTHPNPADLTGKNIADLIIYSGPKGLLRKTIMEQGRARNMEYPFSTIAGKKKWALHDSYLVRDEKSGMDAIQVVIQDITWRKSAEAMLREREEWLTTVLTSIGDAVIAADRHGRIKFMNPVAELLTGWKIDAARDRPVDEIFRIINEETRQPVENPVGKVLNCGCVVGLANHTLLLARDGSECPIVDSGAPIKSPAGEIDGVVLVFRDDTARRLAEDRVLRAKSEAEFHLDLMAHDLTNFAQIAQGNLELMQLHTVLEPRAVQYLANCQRQLARSAALIAKVKMLARIKEQGDGALIPVDLERLVTDAAALVKDMYPDKIVAIAFQPSGGKPARGNEWLDAVFANLFENAVKYTPMPEVRIAVGIAESTAHPDCWEVRIEDHGPGVADAMKERIFTRYPGRDSAKGSGLGLVLAKTIIERLGGTIWMEDRVPGEQARGSAFKFTVPKG